MYILLNDSLEILVEMTDIATLGFIGGFIIMMSLDVALG